MSVSVKCVPSSHSDAEVWISDALHNRLPCDQEPSKMTRRIQRCFRCQQQIHERLLVLKKHGLHREYTRLHMAFQRWILTDILGEYVEETEQRTQKLSRNDRHIFRLHRRHCAACREWTRNSLRPLRQTKRQEARARLAYSFAQAWYHLQLGFGRVTAAGAGCAGLGFIVSATYLSSATFDLTAPSTAVGKDMTIPAPNPHFHYTALYAAMNTVLEVALIALPVLLLFAVTAHMTAHPPPPMLRTPSRRTTTVM